MGGDLSGTYEDIAQAYDLGGVLAADDEPARGLQGQVWRLTTTSGVWAVKQAFVEITEAEARRSGEFQQAARRAGVPAPAVRLTRAGRHIAAIEGVPIRVHSWVEIEEADNRLDPELVGATLAALHQVLLPTEGPPHWWYTEPVGAASWDDIVERALASAAPFADRLAAVRDDLVALEMIMTPMAAVQLCHLDLWADNVRRTPRGGVCIIDWDNCGPADPTRELALVLYEFARTDPVRVALCYAAYRDHGGPGRLREPGDFAMLAAQLGHIGAMHLRRWLDPTSTPAERDRALAGVQEFLDEPLTPAVVSDVLGALD